MEKDSWLTRHLKSAYSKSLIQVLGHRRPVMWGAALLFAISLGVFFTLGSSFLPPFNEGSFTVNVSSMPGERPDAPNSMSTHSE